MKYECIILIILVIVIFSLWYIRENRLKGGFLTSWNADAVTRELIDIITWHIQNENMSYEEMQKSVLQKAPNLQPKHIEAVKALFGTLYRSQIRYRKIADVFPHGNKEFFKFVYAGIVEAFMHLYLVDGIYIELPNEDGFIASGTYNAVLYCQTWRYGRPIGQHVLRLRYINIDEGSVQFNGERAISAKKEAIKNAIQNLNRLYKAIGECDDVIKPLCSSYFLYHDFNDAVVEWSLSKILAVRFPTTKELIMEYIKFVCRIHAMSMKTGYRYLDWKLDNTLYDVDKHRYVIADLDFVHESDKYNDLQPISTIKIPDSIKGNVVAASNYCMMWNLFINIDYYEKLKTNPRLDYATYWNGEARKVSKDLKENLSDDKQIQEMLEEMLEEGI